MSKASTANGAQLNFACNALIILCATALFFLLLSWALGGNDFYNSLTGNFATSILLVGIATCIALKFACRQRQQAGDEDSTTTSTTSCN